MWWRLALLVVLVASTEGQQQCSDGLVASQHPDCPENGGEEATALHLQPGEKARHGRGWGAGLIEEIIETEVLVAGGGSAGTSAAIAAARSGAKTVLVDGRPVLGGNAGSEIRVTMVGACGPRSGAGEENAFKMECREGGIVEEYQLNTAAHNPDHVPELFSLEILTLVKAEPNLTLFQNTWLVGVETAPSDGESNTIVAAICEDQHSQRRYIIRAKVFIDATGDGRLGAEAGADWLQGREGKDVYNESLAVPVSDNETEGTSILYQAADMGAPRTFVAPAWTNKFNQSEFRYRSVSGTVQNGYWWNEVSWPYNTITDGEAVTQTGIANILGIWDFVKNGGHHPEAANMGLTWVGQFGGKREGRRFIGQYVMNQNDVYPGATAGKAWHSEGPPPEPKLFDDRVAYSGWGFDLHNPKGMLDPDHPPFSSTKMPYMFSTPLRSLISKDLSNLFFAGRLASFSHVVYGSQRVMRTCATMGQAVGTAAAYAVLHGIPPIALHATPSAVWSIQQQLLRDDAFIIGVYNQDPRDHARSANVSATSEQLSGNNESNLEGKAINVISGQSRAVVTGPRGGGVPPSQGLNGTNRWISTTLPASITLALPAAVRLAQIQLTFDTGMHRKLNFNPVGAPNDALHWGPQPETVRDYGVEGKMGGGVWTVLCNVTGNYQRRRAHSLPCSAPAPAPKPSPTPIPPAVAKGALTADLCTAAPGQMWSMEEGTGTIRSGDGKLCLGIDSNVSAFGGEGKAVVARPCDESTSAVAWKLTPIPGVGSSSFLKTVKPETCLTQSRDRVACHVTDTTVRSITISGAGSAEFNGVYERRGGVSDGVASFSKDSNYSLYRYDGEWHLGVPGTAVYYASVDKGLGGPPAGPGGWLAMTGQEPVPKAVVCNGNGGNGSAPSGSMCSCAHAVACAACHPTGTDGQTYFPGTSVELADCAAKVTHIEWIRLQVAGGDNQGLVMLMADGLCLGVPATEDVSTPQRQTQSRPQLVRPRNGGSGRSSSWLPAAPVSLTEVRVTVTATNGLDRAIVNELRLYDDNGLAPFPEQPGLKQGRLV